MGKDAIVIVTDEVNDKFYHSFAPKNESIDFFPLKDKKITDYIQTQKADLVLIDCGHDTQSGLEKVKEIKSVRHDVPIIFLTDRSSESTVIEAFKSGAREFYKKPINVFELKNTIELLLYIRKSSKEKRKSLSLQKVTVGDDLGSLVNLVTSDMPTSILKTVTYMKEHLREAYSLERLAQEANLSKYHFCRTFKKFVGISPVRFVTILRINRAKELLRNNNLSISLVAEEMGYNDLSNFERQFKNITGMTPSKFKESQKIPAVSPQSIRN